MTETILITGFGPFPGAPFNPTAWLVPALARSRRPALANVRLVPHVFATRYAAVDRDLPRLIEQHRPRAILMFGLAARTKPVRIETHARNCVAGLPDASGAVRRGAIERGAPSQMRGRAPFQRLLAASRGHGIASTPSRDAGRYVCNYAYWRALHAAPAGNRAPLVAFIHVPKVRRGPVRKRRNPLPGLPGLLAVARAILRAATAEARRPGAAN